MILMEPNFNLMFIIIRSLRAGDNFAGVNSQPCHSLLVKLGICLKLLVTQLSHL